MTGKLEANDFDKWLSQSERIARDNAIASNDAFVEAMARASARGKEKVRPGIYVDTSPPIAAKRLTGEPIMSGCGSSAAMCLSHAVPQQASEAMR